MKRLQTICSLISKCRVFADIGCDHGQVALFVAKNGLADTVVAADISEQCLKKAKVLIENWKKQREFLNSEGRAGDFCDCFSKAEFLGDTDSGKPISKVELFVSDGLKSIPRFPDQIVICGMGGHTIINILTDYFDKIKKENSILKNSSQPIAPPALILSPHTDTPSVRRFLSQNGYYLSSDILISDKDKFYYAIKAEKTSAFSKKTDKKRQKLSPLQLEFGVFYKNKCPDMAKKLDISLQKTSQFKPTPQNKKTIKQIKKAQKWQK
ncbi:MAG: class I SAM-dependent methyltransferase [Firmicutes bacterium]|nr:class I SAM-dependent methyltransferase [Bacillota bacterium]